MFRRTKGRQCLAVRDCCPWRSEKILAKTTVPGNVAELLQDVRDSPDMMKYWESAQALAQINSRRPTRGLISIARDAREVERRAAALHAVWRLTDPRGTEICLAVAANLAGEAERPRMIAVEGLSV